jgi:hypothetical protein
VRSRINSVGHALADKLDKNTMIVSGAADSATKGLKTSKEILSRVS